MYIVLEKNLTSSRWMNLRHKRLGASDQTCSRWMNLRHKRLDASDQTCQGTQRRDTFQVRSNNVMPA